MKKRTKIVAVICCVAIVAFAMCACLSNQSTVKGSDVTSNSDNIITTQNVINYNVNATTTDIAVAANIGLKSAVSVYSNFTKTSGGSWYFPSQQKETTYTTAGAGVIYRLYDDGSALIITNHHVVYDNDSNTSSHISNDINVFLYGMENTSYAMSATYIGGSMYYDIAVLFVEANDILKQAAENQTVAAVNFADSDKVHVGENSIAIGNPEAEGISVSSGIISVDSEYITMTAVDEKTEVTMRVMRTDSAVNSGNSGGGLYDLSGQLIGIVNAKMNTSTAENIAYAIPSNLVYAVVQNIIYYCYDSTCVNVMRPMVGITTQTAALSTELDDDNLLVKVETVKISKVDSTGVAYEKLQVGDIVKSITLNGVTTEITRAYQISETLLYARKDDVATFVVERDGEEKTVEITITSGAITAY